MKWRTVAIALACLLVGLGVAARWHQYLLPATLHWLDIGTAPQQADAVFVLLGGDDTRPFVAAALQKTGFAPQILVSEAHAPVNTKYSRAKHLVFRDIMVARGVPEEAILIIGDPVHNTMKESEALRSYLRDHPEDRVLVVTTHFHTRRTRWSLRRQLGANAARLTFVSAPHDDFDADDWWLYAGGFELVLMEYIKLLGYFFVYGAGFWYLGGFAMIVLGLAWRWRRRTRSDPADAPAAAPPVTDTI